MPMASIGTVSFVISFRHCCIVDVKRRKDDNNLKDGVGGHADVC